MGMHATAQVRTKSSHMCDDETHTTTDTPTHAQMCGVRNAMCERSPSSCGVNIIIIIIGIGSEINIMSERSDNVRCAREVFVGVRVCVCVFSENAAAVFARSREQTDYRNCACMRHTNDKRSDSQTVD